MRFTALLGIVIFACAYYFRCPFASIETADVDGRSDGRFFMLNVWLVCRLWGRPKVLWSTLSRG